MSRIAEIQEILRKLGIPGWLFYDHHRRDPLAYRILQFEPPRTPTRRWFYFIPAQGEPQALVHRIEPGMLDALPGNKRLYASWESLAGALAVMLEGVESVAMQHSPHCAIPYVALVDGGTVELVQSVGPRVVTSADLVQYFEARWSEQQRQSHFEAGVRVDAIRRAAFQRISDAHRRGEIPNEFQIQQFIRQAVAQNGMVIDDHGPIVAVNANASNPHYDPTAKDHAEIRPGDLVLIDLWAKLEAPNSVFYDITWVGYCGPNPPEKMLQIFDVVIGARNAAIQAVKDAVASQTPLAGYQVDDVCRGFIQARGWGEYFIHRTGHSIGTEVHGTGANMDNLESHDTRQIIPGLCFSIEPGIYLPEFGIRSEVNVYVGEREAVVTGEVQEKLLLL
ncbi:MAG: M24 family metallopeptidase [Bryobacteraceae bacterium]|nr:M24 family metallopeptidase [Bryobacteraceae bacterium]MDW8379276.1 M24 family metallopeptidase [Bryobacterales bacterium]